MGYLVFEACELRFHAPERLWYKGEFGVQGYGILVIWERHTCIHGQIDSMRGIRSYDFVLPEWDVQVSGLMVPLGTIWGFDSRGSLPIKPRSITP